MYCETLESHSLISVSSCCCQSVQLVFFTFKPFHFGQRPRTGPQSQQFKALGFQLGTIHQWEAGVKNIEALIIIKAFFLVGTSSQFLLNYNFLNFFVVLFLLLAGSLGQNMSLASKALYL